MVSAAFECERDRTYVHARGIVCLGAHEVVNVSNGGIMYSYPYLRKRPKIVDHSSFPVRGF